MIRTTIPQFLSRFEKLNTKTGYTVSLNQFFDGFAKMTPDAYFSDGRNAEQDLHEFKAHLKARGLAPKSVESKIGAVFSYFLANRVITRELWKELNLQNQSKVQDRVPSAKELKQIIMQTDIRGKALFLTLASSGMRLGDALSIQMDDRFFVNLRKNPPRIWLHCEKVNTDYYAFITDETRDAIQGWLKYRNQWIKTAVRNSNGYKTENGQDYRLFPFSGFSANRLWNLALQKAGLTVIDKSTQQERRTLHLHTLRKFNRTVTGQTLSHDISEALLCHLTGLTKTYFRPDGDQVLAKEYARVHDKLRILTTAVPDCDTTSTIDQQNDKIASLERMVQNILRQVQHDRETSELQAQDHELNEKYARREL